MLTYKTYIIKCNKPIKQLRNFYKILSKNKVELIEAMHLMNFKASKIVDFPYLY